MPDLHHKDHEHGMLNLVEDTIVPDHNAVGTFLAGDLHGPVRVRIFAEGFRLFDDPSPNVLGQLLKSAQNAGNENDAVGIRHDLQTEAPLHFL